MMVRGGPDEKKELDERNKKDERMICGRGKPPLPPFYRMFDLTTRNLTL
jgi:hypothetical protein